MQPDAHELLLQRLQSDAIKRNQMQSSAIKRLTSPLKIPNPSSCNQIQSDAIQCNQEVDLALEDPKPEQLQSDSIRCNPVQSRG
jgi:hypothetical protein